MHANFHSISATYYYQNGVAGACGKVHGDNDLIAAIGEQADYLVRVVEIVLTFRWCRRRPLRQPGRGVFSVQQASQDHEHEEWKGTSCALQSNTRLMLFFFKLGRYGDHCRRLPNLHKQQLD